MDLNKNEQEIWDDSKTFEEFLLRCKTKDGLSNTEFRKLLAEFQKKKEEDTRSEPNMDIEDED